MVRFDLIVNEPKVVEAGKRVYHLQHELKGVAGEGSHLYCEHAYGFDIKLTVKTRIGEALCRRAALTDITISILISTFNLYH